MADVIKNKREMYDITPFSVPALYYNIVGSGAISTVGLTNGAFKNEIDGQNSSWDSDFVCGSGIYSIVFTVNKASSYGIIDVNIDGNAIGSLDLYSAASVIETNITLSNVSLYTGKHTMHFSVTTKHASSSGYSYVLDIYQLERTGDYTGAPVDVVPQNNFVEPFWYAALIRNAPNGSANYFSMSRLYDSAVYNIGQAMTVKIETRPGIYTLNLMLEKNTASGILTIKINGTTLETVDLYNASTVYNFSHTTGQFTTGNATAIELSSTTKNNSSSNYMFVVLHYKLNYVSPAPSDISISSGFQNRKFLPLSASDFYSVTSFSKSRIVIDAFLLRGNIVETSTPAKPAGDYLEIDRFMEKGVYNFAFSSSSGVTKANLYDLYVDGIKKGTFNIGTSTGAPRIVMENVSVLETKMQKIRLVSAHTGDLIPWFQTINWHRIS